jgi:sec-independent protein translocase protein TatA
MPQLGPIEFILVLIVFFIFFGAGKLGQLGGALGRGLKEFRKNASLDEPTKGDQPKDGPA